MQGTHWWLVSYDVRDPKRLRKAAKHMEGYGERIQYSVFRCWLNPRGMERLRWWSSPRKMEPRLRVVRVVRALEFLRRQIPQGGVQADAVVERFDVLEDTCLSFRAGGVPLVVDQFPLQAG